MAAGEKCCLLLHGAMRTFRQTLPSILTNLIEPNNCDVFIFTSRSNHTRSRWNLEDDAIQYIKDLLGDRLKSMTLAEDISGYVEESERLQRDAWARIPDDTDAEIAHINQACDYYYKLYLCYLDMLDYREEGYDIIARCRPDLLIKEKIDLKGEPDTVYCYSVFQPPEHVWKGYQMWNYDYFICDFFTAGNKDVMETVCKTVLSWPRFSQRLLCWSKDNRTYCSEYQMGQLFHHEGWKIESIGVAKIDLRRSVTCQAVVVRP